MIDSSAGAGTLGLEPGQKTEITKRLKAFLQAYKDFFAKNGGFPMWGRSWFYKPGILIPFEGVRFVRVRRMATRLPYWMDYGTGLPAV